MSGLTANLKKNDNNNSHVTIPSVGKTGRDVTSRDQLYLTQLMVSNLGERESEPLTKNYSGVGGRTQ